MKNKLRSLLIVLSMTIFVFSLSTNLIAQTQRNPVLEFCTGTWCQWCPCGDDMILDNILPNIPNAIFLAYHGAGSDPYRIFNGSNILSLLGLSSYPTGVIDRVTGIQPWNSGWTNNMNSRNNVPATVSIEIDRSYNTITRQLTATIDFTALQNLNAQYSYNIILVEDGQVYGQTSNNTCSPGTTFFPDYVHYWLVRDMMNGATGEEIVNGAWNQGQLISKNFSYTIPIPNPAPDYDPDNCGIVVMVYKNGAPLNSNAEIQQAEQYPLISPNYVISINSASDDMLIQNSGVGEFTAVIGNEGLLDDSYYIDVSMTGPSGWSGEFTTPNGTFNFGQQDLVAVSSGDTLAVDISVLPNVINGSAEIMIEFTSMNDPNINISTSFGLVTLTGVPGLIIDASGEGYADVVVSGMDQAFDYPYGMVTSGALSSPVDLTNFTFISWTSGYALPVFTQDQVDALTPFLDNGGRLLINGQDIGEDIFDVNGQSQFAQSFYNDYLHADFIANGGVLFFFRGIDNDPISDQINFAPSDLYPRDPDRFDPYDASATSMFTFGTNPEYSSVRADDGTNRVVYLGFGLEQITDSAVRDTILTRSINWLMNGIVLSTPNEELIAKSYNLGQNYPNPFNPATTISYSIPEESQVSLIIYDIMGRQIAELVKSKQSAGAYNIDFDASSIASGTYFYKLSAGEFISVKKMVLLK